MKEDVDTSKWNDLHWTAKHAVRLFFHSISKFHSNNNRCSPWVVFPLEKEFYHFHYVCNSKQTKKPSTIHSLYNNCFLSMKVAENCLNVKTQRMHGMKISFNFCRGMCLCQFAPEPDSARIQDVSMIRCRKKGNYFTCLCHRKFACMLQSKQTHWASIPYRNAVQILLSHCCDWLRNGKLPNTPNTLQNINKYYILIRWKYDRLNATNDSKRTKSHPKTSQ